MASDLKKLAATHRQANRFKDQNSRCSSTGSEVDRAANEHEGPQTPEAAAGVRSPRTYAGTDSSFRSICVAPGPCSSEMEGISRMRPASFSKSCWIVAGSSGGTAPHRRSGSGRPADLRSAKEVSQLKAAVLPDDHCLSTVDSSMVELAGSASACSTQARALFLDSRGRRPGHTNGGPSVRRPDPHRSLDPGVQLRPVVGRQRLGHAGRQGAPGPARLRGKVSQRRHSR